MKLNISYVRPCSERNKLTARLDFEGRLNTERIRQEFDSRDSEELGVVMFRLDNVEVIVSKNHIDIRNIEKEHEALKIIETMKQFLTGTS